MIVVDPVQSGPTPWPSGRYSHLTSDTSVAELLDFGRSIGLHLSWFQHRALHPHFDVSPLYRAKAIRAGAQAVSAREYLEAVRRFRERNPESWTPPNSR